MWVKTHSSQRDISLVSNVCCRFKQMPFSKKPPGQRWWFFLCHQIAISIESFLLKATQASSPALAYNLTTPLKKPRSLLTAAHEELT